MAVEELFTDEFIRARELYLYSSRADESTGEIIFYVAEKKPSVIRHVLKTSLTHHGILPVAVVNGDYKRQGILLLRHDYSGVLLDETYAKGALEQIYHLWQRPIYLETKNEEGLFIYQFDGKNHSIKK